MPQTSFTIHGVTDVLGNPCQQVGGLWRIPSGQFNVFFTYANGPDLGTLIGIEGCGKPPAEMPSNPNVVAGGSSPASPNPTQQIPNRWWWLGDNNHVGEGEQLIEIRLWPRWETVDGHGSVQVSYQPEDNQGM